MSSRATLRRKDHFIRARRRPFSRIVVGVDSSPASERAARLAVSLARGDAHIELVFCHAIDIPRMLARADRFADDYALALEIARDEARCLLDRCVALARQAGIHGLSCIRYGRPATEVVTLADVFAADLVVIGNRPSGRMHRFLCGSIRDEMVRACSTPILVADADPSRPSEFRPGSILARLADPPASPAALRLAAKIATAYDGKVVFSTGPAAAEDGPGMIVIGAARKRGVRDLFVPDAVERALQSADVPVLVVHD
jgi:nucleotide-binding universal stress UspA family protein